MLRMTIRTTFLLLACCVCLHADEPVSVLLNELIKPSAKAIAKEELVDEAKGAVKTLGVAAESAVSPAVHVNTNGLEYGSTGGENKAVNRLRTARESVVLPPAKPAAKVVKPTKTSIEEGTNDAIESFLGATSRRKKAAKIVPKLTDDVKTAEVPLAKKVKKPLASIMTKKEEPQLATPVEPAAPRIATLPPKTLPKPAAPSVNKPTLPSPTLAAPQLAPKSSAPNLTAPAMLPPNSVGSAASAKSSEGSMAFPTVTEFPSSLPLSSPNSI